MAYIIVERLNSVVKQNIEPIVFDTQLTEYWSIPIRPILMVFWQRLLCRPKERQWKKLYRRTSSSTATISLLFHYTSIHDRTINSSNKTHVGRWKNNSVLSILFYLQAQIMCPRNFDKIDIKLKKRGVPWFKTQKTW